MPGLTDVPDGFELVDLVDLSGGELQLELFEQLVELEQQLFQFQLELQLQQLVELEQLELQQLFQQL